MFREEEEEKKTRATGTLGSPYPLKGDNELQAISFEGSTVCTYFRSSQHEPTLNHTPCALSTFANIGVRNGESLRSNIKTHKLAS